MSERHQPSDRTPARMTDLLRVPPGPVDLTAYDPRATPGFDGGKSAGAAALDELGESLQELQERLYAEGAVGGSRAVLIVLQGMDTSGKSGTIRAVLSKVDPQGTVVASFKAPTAEELEHDFLWRIRPRLPRPGLIGVFDRSHYEDVLVVRVHDLVPPEVWGGRYDAINAFEAEIVAGGTKLLKVFLHLSAKEQRKRLLARLDDPTKHWKFNQSDLDEREYWEAYQEGYAEALSRCASEVAPWHLVPADHKWYRNLAVGRLLAELLDEMALTWPPGDFDVEAQRKRLRAGP